MSKTTMEIRREQGLCLWCGGEPRPNRRSCLVCAERNRQFTAEKIRKNIEAGVCASCSSSPICEGSKRYCSTCLVAKAEAKKEAYYKCKEEVFAYYGGYECACCGEKEKVFLTIDHIDGGGRQHRREIRIDFYLWLKRNNFPDGYQVLCMNCQFGKRFCGECPHKTRSST